MSESSYPESTPGPYQFGGRLDRLDYLRAGYGFNQEEEIVGHWKQFWNEYRELNQERQSEGVNAERHEELGRATNQMLFDQFSVSIAESEMYGVLVAIDHEAPTVRYELASDLRRLWSLDKDVTIAAALRLTHDEEVEVRFAALEQLSALLFDEDKDSTYVETMVPEDDEKRGDLIEIFWLAIGNINAARENQRPPIFKQSITF